MHLTDQCMHAVYSTALARPSDAVNPLPPGYGNAYIQPHCRLINRVDTRLRSSISRMCRQIAGLNRVRYRQWRTLSPEQSIVFHISQVPERRAGCSRRPATSPIDLTTKIDLNGGRPLANGKIS